jgi:hypothetical protein
MTIPLGVVQQIGTYSVADNVEHEGFTVRLELELVKEGLENAIL